MIRIYRKDDLNLMTTVPSNMTVEEEITLNTIPNYGGAIDDYDHIETEYERFHLERVNGIVTAIEDGLTSQEQKDIIMRQLATLDNTLTRTDENVIKHLMETQDYQPYQREIDIMTQKESLRDQLKLL